MKNEQSFIRRGIVSYKEVAMMYMPESTSVEYATSVLTKMIKANKELVRRLADTGFRKGSKYFTPRQFKLILHYLGPIECNTLDDDF